MAGNNKISFLKGTSEKRLTSTEVLNYGQPFYETDTKTLYIGSVSTGESLSQVTPVRPDMSYIFDLIYPVGSIYMSVNSVDPSTIFGGVWERWGKGRTVVSVDDENYQSAELTGGSNSVILTESNLPSHTHTTVEHSHSDGTLTASSNSHSHTLSSATVSISSSGDHTHSYECLGHESSSSNSYQQGSGDSFTWHKHGVSYLATESDGEHTHTATITGSTSSESHSHSVTGTTSSTTVVVNSTGSSEAFNIQNEYITCYMWKRVE